MRSLLVETQPFRELFRRATYSFFDFSENWSKKIK